MRCLGGFDWEGVGPHLNLCRMLVVMLVEVQIDITHHCCRPENAFINLESFKLSLYVTLSVISMIESNIVVNYQSLNGVHGC